MKKKTKQILFPNKGPRKAKKVYKNHHPYLYAVAAPAPAAAAATGN